MEPTESATDPPAPEPSAEPAPPVEAAEAGAAPPEEDTPPPSDSTLTEAPDESNPPPAGPALTFEEAVAKAQAGRLSARDERAVVEALKTTLLSGKSGVAAAAAALPKFAWMVGVGGVTAAWPEMKPTARTQLLKALGDEEQTDALRRLRLSVARGLHKIGDLPAALKLGLAVVKELRDPESGEFPQKNAQIFDSVLLGKARPWCAQLPLGELKAGEADLLVHCAVLAAFHLSHPPITQLGVIKWAAEADRLSNLEAEAVSAIARAVARWSAKWQNALRKEVPELPEEIANALKSDAEAAASEPGGDFTSESADDADEGAAPPREAGEDEAAPDPAQRTERPVYVSKTIPPRDSRDSASSQQQPQMQQTPLPQQRGERGERGGPLAKSLTFNVTDALRQVEAHVAWLRMEIKNAEKRTRTREDDPRRRRKAEAPGIPGEPTAEELARLNGQLEDRIAELQTRIDDLTADSESRAVSIGAITGAEPPAPDQQLRTLLALKLQDDYDDYLALEQESRDLVVQQHYRTLLHEVFEVLKGEGVPLAETAGEAGG